MTNHIHNGVDILMHRLGPESQGLEAASAKGFVADQVVSSLIGFEMVWTVDFDNQTSVEAYEVQDIVQERRLPTKVEAFGA